MYRAAFETFEGTRDSGDLDDRRAMGEGEPFIGDAANALPRQPPEMLCGVWTFITATGALGVDGEGRGREGADTGRLAATLGPEAGIGGGTGYTFCEFCQERRACSRSRLANSTIETGGEGGVSITPPAGLCKLLAL